jgi:thioredoxin reductase
MSLNEERLSEAPDVAGAYPRLSDMQIELLSRRGEQRPVQRGDVLVAEGQRDRDGRPEGTSVYYAATFMEAVFCERQPVSVVGGGNSAGQATVFLARHAAQVRLIILHDDLNRDMSRYLTSGRKPSCWRH